MKVIGWRAWYTEGRVYESTSTKWESLPATGVLFVMLYFVEKTVGGRRYREALYGCDYYWQESADVFKNEDMKPQNVKTKAGTLISDVEFEALVAKAFASERL